MHEAIEKYFYWLYYTRGGVSIYYSVSFFKYFLKSYTVRLKANEYVNHGKNAPIVSKKRQF